MRFGYDPTLGQTISVSHMLFRRVRVEPAHYFMDVRWVQHSLDNDAVVPRLSELGAYRCEVQQIIDLVPTIPLQRDLKPGIAEQADRPKLKLRLPQHFAGSLSLIRLLRHDPDRVSPR